MVRFARSATADVTRRRGTTVDRWSHAETVALLQAVEPWERPENAGVVAVHDRHVKVRPSRVPPPHAALVSCGRVVAALDLALRARGRVPRVHIDDTTDPPVVTISPGTRRPAAGRDRARRRAEHRWHNGPEQRPGRVDGRTLVRIVSGAETAGARLCLLNGPSRDGAPAWCPPGEAPGEPWGVELPWGRAPVLAACAYGDGARGAVVAGLVAHRAGVEAARHAHRAVLHPLAAARAVPDRLRPDLVGDGPETDQPWRVHALVHVDG